MQNYLPSKKFIKFFSFVILGTVLVWGVSFLFSKKSSYENKDIRNKNSTGNEEFSIYTLDTDGDGIFDWEEGLWGTNPNKADSDGDGISDGEDIKVRKEKILEKNNLSEDDLENQNLNQTELFARQFLSVASLAQQSGGLSQEAVNEFSKSFGSAIQNNQIEDPFTVEKIKVGSISPADYKKSLNPIFEEFTNNRIVEVEIFYKLSQKDLSAIPELEKSIKSYSDLSNKLLSVTAPFSIAGTHLSIINSAAKISIAMVNIKDITDNPLESMIGIGQYNRYMTELENAVDNLSNYFSSNGIIN
ncbi:MAG: hypothetical protein IT284_00365 [Bacteroidetes bacterium]|nr:hypothetical protein [Bacteroidota bacterium]